MMKTESDDERSVSSESRSTSTGGEATNRENGSESSSSFSLARSETRLVNRSKLLVLGTILLAAGAVGCLVYFLLSKEETSRFEAQSTAYAQEVAELVHFEAYNVYTSIESLSTTITSFAVASNSAWPNVTFPFMEVQGIQFLKLSMARQITFLPLISKESLGQWEEYSQVNGEEWYLESRAYQDELKVNNVTLVHNHGKGRVLQSDQDMTEIPSRVWQYEEGLSGKRIPVEVHNLNYGPGDYAPIWQQVPAPRNASKINYDLLSHPTFNRVYHGMWESRLPVLTEVADIPFMHDMEEGDTHEEPISYLLQPLYPSFKVGLHERDDIVGFLVASIPWHNYFQQLLSSSVKGIILVVHDTCGDFFTYKVDGALATYLGQGDLHDRKYTDLGLYTKFAPFLKHNISDTNEHCEYGLEIYPSAEFESSYVTNKPELYAGIVVLIFICTAMTFILYDYLVQRRQDKVMATAKRTNMIVSSLFPATVRDRILKEAEEQAEEDLKQNKKTFLGAKSKLKSFLDEGNDIDANDADRSRPIADLFPEVTVMFADIVGFTAWSSVREPSQVFQLLETLFSEFDRIASSRGVFKVETVGDCYVAVTGLPEPRKDHALVMARYARDILYSMNVLTKKLEVTLGPDTGDLSLRIGLHSGQVTAGVLRGDKSRFQLFGDTMNTCARIENSGERNKIHLSSETAALLVNANKSHWIREREDLVNAKGKGALKTYWLALKMPTTESKGSSNDQSKSCDYEEDAEVVTRKIKAKGNQQVMDDRVDEKTLRLVQWNTDVLSRLLKEVIARRQAAQGEKSSLDYRKSLRVVTKPGETVLDEVAEIIRLPEFDAKAANAEVNPSSVELCDTVVAQLREYITIIATLYRENPFHNFEHASHVTMSVVKLLSRIVAPDSLEGTGKDIESSLHDHTYGITSDPLTQFACVFAALIHDVDHTGVPNTQLVKDQVPIAVAYKGKSVAEQNSVDMAWSLLMDDNFSELRGALFASADDLKRFRQLVVNAVMATDIMDKDAGAFRKQRWEKAFSPNHVDVNERDTVNRKATIVIEHLIQASDVAHTMQHWHIFRKWNSRLFTEMYKAFKEGRAETDPSINWYKGEIGFFDFYVIPLAKKLKDCGVFGVSSDEYLNYAQKNRNEWELRGQEVVAEMVANVMEEYDDMSVATEHEEATPSTDPPMVLSEELTVIQDSDKATLDVQTSVVDGEAPTFGTTTVSPKRVVRVSEGARPSSVGGSAASGRMFL